MSTQGLTQSEKQLLERYHDGALAGAEHARAEALSAQVSMARDYVGSLKEIGTATRAAEQQMWSGAQAPSVEQLVEVAMAGGEPLEGLELASLTSMLVRFHDGEVTGEEAQEVAHLRQVREDVSMYLDGLLELELGVQSAAKEAVDAVDFSGFWGRLESAMDEEDTFTGEPVKDVPVNVLSFSRATRERPSFNNDDHQVLLYRYHDGEASEEERQQVSAWQEIDPNVAKTLGALSELRLAACASMELAEEHIEPGSLWALIEDRLEEPAQKVASLSAYRGSKQELAAPAVASNHRREIFIAMAAVLCTVMGVALFGGDLFPGNKVIVEKTVVIVDSLEYGDGTSVMVTGPMQTASMAVGRGDAVSDAEADAEEATPTVIWLIDPEADVQEREGAPSTSEGKSAEQEPQGKPI